MSISTNGSPADGYGRSTSKCPTIQKAGRGVRVEARKHSSCNCKGFSYPALALVIPLKTTHFMGSGIIACTKDSKVESAERLLHQSRLMAVIPTGVSIS